MSVAQKLKFFNLLVDVGFREIEVGFPSASRVDYEFVRRLITEDLCPDGVTIQVLTPARLELVETTLEAIRGAKSAIVHLYSSTSPIQRKVVFGLSEDRIIKLAVDATKSIRDHVRTSGHRGLRLEYSPEGFSGTEAEFAIEICNAVRSEWNPDLNGPVVLNLPSTVEISTPNVFADQIEHFISRVGNRGSVLVSVHTHNDRGTGVAAAELALLAACRT